MKEKAKGDKAAQAEAKAETQEKEAAANKKTAESKSKQLEGQIKTKTTEMLKSIQSVAIKIMEEDPNLEKEKNYELKEQIEKKFKERIEI